MNEPLPATDAALSVLSRRGFLLKSSVLAAEMAAILPSLSSRAIAAAPAGPENSPSTTSNKKRMNYITTKDGTEIYYKDWDSGPVVSFSHGWPLSADAWEAQMFHLASNGFRCIAHGGTDGIWGKVGRLGQVEADALVGAARPTWTAVGVNWLAGFDFEIKVIARIPG